MKVTTSSVFKLSIVLALACLYALGSLPGSSAASTPEQQAGQESQLPRTDAQVRGQRRQFGDREKQIRADYDKKSQGCLSCHQGIEDMHNDAVLIGCTDCHGGNASVSKGGAARPSAEYTRLTNEAHVLPADPNRWPKRDDGIIVSANPERAYELTQQESLEYVRFVNPGDLRVAHISCGTSDCHSGDVHNVKSSMMTTGVMLWGAALYNNGSVPHKIYRWGESYGPDGKPQRLMTIPQPTGPNFSGPYYMVTDYTLHMLKSEKLPDDMLGRLAAIKKQSFADAPAFWSAVEKAVSSARVADHRPRILKHALVVNGPTYRLTDRSLLGLQDEGVSAESVAKLESIKNQKFATEQEYLAAVEAVIGRDEPGRMAAAFLAHAEVRDEGILNFIDPLPRWEISQMGNILRTFERGGRRAAEIGNPMLEEPPGKPTQNLLSQRGLGTLLTTDPTYLGLQKTRLLDPMLSKPGSNDHPGDFRASGCTACHVVYGNSRDAFQSGQFARQYDGEMLKDWDKVGHLGFSRSADQTIPENEPGHPIKHRMTREIPSSQCVVCHMHPGTLVLNSYFGTMWWDLETDGESMYPKESRKLSPEEQREILKRNPEESSLRGLWGDTEFLENLRDNINKNLKHTQFNDFAGHGWVFRDVFKKDRKGRLLDHNDNVITELNNDKLKQAVAEEPEKLANRDGVPVHLKDIHLEKGMHCVDCHFRQDNHGNGKLYGEVRNAVEIDCVDCHGTIQRRADPLSRDARTAAAAGGNRMLDYRYVGGDVERFVWVPVYHVTPDLINNLREVRAPATVLSALEGLRGQRLLGINPLKAALGDRAVKDYRQLIEKYGRAKAPNDMALVQRAAVKDADGKRREWEVKQIKDLVTAGHDLYNEKAALAKTIQKHEGASPQDKPEWGDPNLSDKKLAHANTRMTCFSCHLSWTPSCYGCHLKMTANQKRSMLHNEDEQELRNWVGYNFQTLRDDVFLLGRDGNVTGNRIAPVRSACAVLVSSQNALREWLYFAQQTVSQEGYSGQAFSSHFPHTVRTRETKDCSDCHLSDKNDNNAYMAMVLMQGTNFYNWMGRYVYTALGEEGYAAIVATEREEPQAVIGSHLHQLAFPDEYKKYKKHKIGEGAHHGEEAGHGKEGEHGKPAGEHKPDGHAKPDAGHKPDGHAKAEGGHGKSGDHQVVELHEFYEHPGNDITNALIPFRKQKTEVLNLQLRGEYLYAACGEGGFRFFDVANVDQKGFSERMTTAPFSPLGQKFYVPSKFATAIASPSTLAVDPTATLQELLKFKDGYRFYNPINSEGIYRDDGQAIPLVYGFLYGADREEGLVVIGNSPQERRNKPGVATLLDGDPYNNFIGRAATFNPDGILKGANNITVAGTYGYITCDRGLVVVDLNNPLVPQVVGVIGEPHLRQPKAVQIQFRYAFVCDADGVKVIDVTDPKQARPVEGAVVKLKEANSIYPVRTHAYVAAGKEGLAIIDIEDPAHPKLVETYDAEGEINDARDVKVTATYVSLFAYIAGGKQGLQIVQLISPEETPGHYGFSPRPTPRLIAAHHTHAPALAVSEGIDRDRAVDESGYQLSVFGRKGARPFNKEELERMYKYKGQLYNVPDIDDRQIRDADRRNGIKAIRDFYGEPKRRETVQGAPPAAETPAAEPRKSAALVPGQGRLSPATGLFGLAVLALPLGVALFLRRR